MQLAYDRGKRAEDFTSWERNYLLGEQKEDDCIAVAYNQHCYIFRKGSSSDIVCITMYPLPNWFGKKKAHYYHKNERVKNMRRIAKETEAASRAHQEATAEGIAFSHD